MTCSQADDTVQLTDMTRTSSAMHMNVIPFCTTMWNKCRSCEYETRLRTHQTVLGRQQGNSCISQLPGTLRAPDHLAYHMQNSTAGSAPLLGHTCLDLQLFPVYGAPPSVRCLLPCCTAQQRKHTMPCLIYRESSVILGNEFAACGHLPVLCKHGCASGNQRVQYGVWHRNVLTCLRQAVPRKPCPISSAPHKR